MNFENFKDPLIVSALFFLIASDWFDRWLRDMFPSLNSTNPILYNLMKTALFAGLYWLYHKFFPKSNPAVASQ